VIAYRANLDVPKELVRYASRLLAAVRRARGTRKGTRAAPAAANTPPATPTPTTTAARSESAT
jgi:hypothetical protein